ncbi:MAG: type II toxin-antitoxin system RelE/ParE family toxin [Parvibaculaceae bacterium]
MSRLKISEQAMADLDGIWDYIADDNPVAADRLLDRINAHCQSYAHQPELGEARPELGSSLRSFSVGMYVVYYRATSEGIEVARVLHGARDVDRLF